MNNKHMILLVSCFFSLPAFAQSDSEYSPINKCANEQKAIIYTDFECPEGYEIVTEGWLNETNLTNAEKFGDDVRQESKDNNMYQRIID